MTPSMSTLPFKVLETVPCVKPVANRRLTPLGASLKNLRKGSVKIDLPSDSANRRKAMVLIQNTCRNINSNKSSPKGSTLTTHLEGDSIYVFRQKGSL